VSTSDPVAAGWAALREARWEAARELFAAAETPEALEGLSWAAWWLDDEEAVFAAREGSYRLYRERGDAAGAARMATWLAADTLDFRGAWSVASGWLRRAWSSRPAGCVSVKAVDVSSFGVVAPSTTAVLSPVARAAASEPAGGPRCGYSPMTARAAAAMASTERSTSSAAVCQLHTESRMQRRPRQVVPLG
jgi:hypothetical protein